LKREGLSLPSFSPFSYQEKVKDAPTGVGWGMSLKITVYGNDLTPWPPLLKGEGEY